MATTTTESDHFSAVQPRPIPDSALVHIPVVVHAFHRSPARGEAGEAQPVHEETSTVIVFPSGAVVYLSASLSPGELVVLTNQQNRVDMLCRVLNIREQMGGRSYVELEFTQRSSRFWSLGTKEMTEPGAPTAEVAVTHRGFPVSENRPISDLRPIIKAEPEASFPVATKASTPPSLGGSLASTDALAAAIPERASGNNAVQALAQSAQPDGFERGTLPVASTHAGFAKLGSSKVIWAAGTSVVVLLLSVGVFLQSRPRQSAPPLEVLSDRPSGKTQPVVARTNEQPPLRDAASTEVSPTPSPDKPATDPARKDFEETQPRRGPIRVGKLTTPLPKEPRSAGPDEPPPTLPVEGMHLADHSGGTDSLADSARLDSLAAFVPAANSPTPPPGEFKGPQIISSTVPIYPDFARAQGLDGVVVIDAFIDVGGKVADAKVLSGPVLLRQAALDAVRKWKYQPAELNGEPVTSHQTVNVNFVHR